MQTEGPDEGSPGAAEGPPSARSRDALTDDLRREVADAHLRLEEAGLRAEAHRLLGNHEEALEATEEQQAILAEVESRLARVVSTAVVQRDAEHVLARATPAPVPAATEPPRPPDETRPRVPMLSGVASVLALAAVATAAILGISRGLAPVEVVGAAADTATEDQVEASSSPDDASSSPAITAVRPTGDLADRPASEVAPSDPLDSSPDAAATSSPDPAEATPTEDPTDDEDPDLGQAVTDLLDAVGQLGGDAGPDGPTPSEDALPGSDADVSGPDLDTLVEDVAPEASDDATDGFVPAPSAQ